METPPPPPPIADDSADRAKQWANEHVAGEFSVTRLGRQTGYPAYVVRVGAPGKPPQREIPIVVVLEKVWTGPSGWASFVEQEGIADPVKTAAAWLALKKGEPQEPFGSVRLYKRQPAPDPRWAGDRLSLIYAGNRSQPMIVELRISPQGTVEVTSERPWVAPPR